MSRSNRSNTTPIRFTAAGVRWFTLMLHLAGAAARTSPPQHHRRMRTNISWALAGNIIYAITQWVSLTALAKLGNPEMVGYYALAAATMNPIIAFSNLQLRSLQATEVGSRFCFADYFGVRLITTLGAFAVAIAVAILAGYDQSLVLVFLLMMMRKCVDSLSDILYGLFQKQERMDCVAISMTLSGVLSLSGLAVAVYLTDSLVIGLGASLVATILTLGMYTIPATIHILTTHPAGDGGVRSSIVGAIRPKWNSTTTPALIGMAAPLGLVTLLVSVGENAPGYLVGHELGAESLGIFAALWYATTAGSTAMSAIAQSLSPRLAHLYNGGCIPEFRRLLGKLVAVGLSTGALGGALVFVVGKQLVTVMYAPEYAEYVDVFFLLVVAAGVAFAASFLSHGLIAARRLRAQVPLLAAVTLVAVAASALLIPRFGLTGAAVAIGGANTVQLLGGIVILARASGPRHGVDHSEAGGGSRLAMKVKATHDHIRTAESR